ncbi:MAG: pYEATS domain-containing protein [Pseudomonadota bacterium]
MSYRIEQDSKYLGNHRWRWRTWIEAREEALDKVKQVTWFLHHTFPKPVLTKRNRSEKFAIQTVGWGMFLIRAEVATKDGRTVPLEHWLELAYGEDKEGQPTPPAPLRGAPRKNRVFLSYGAEDEKLAARIKTRLEDQGFQILDPKQIETDVPWDAAVRKMVRESDVVVGLVTSDYVSPSVLNELNSASQSRKPTIALVEQGVGQPFGLESGTNRIELDLKSGGGDQMLGDILMKIAPVDEG